MFTSRRPALLEAFGLGSEPMAPLGPLPSLPDAALVFVTGTSGAGKSTWLREKVRALPDVYTLPEALPAGVAVVDLLDRPLEETISYWGRFGLGDARILSMETDRLSEGQVFRVRLGMALARIPSGTRALLVVDEFLSVVDRPTAKTVAHQFQKICRARGIRAVVATAHEDLAATLRPDAVVRFRLGQTPVVESGEDFRHGVEEGTDDRARLFASLGLRIEEGTPVDAQQLAPFHYVEEPSSGGEENERHIVAKHQDDVAGLCTWKRPVPAAWERSSVFSALNAQVVLRHRTIIHPSFRGLGLTGALEPREVTEGLVTAVAATAMGRFVPFHKAAGYVEDPIGRSVWEFGRASTLDAVRRLAPLNSQDASWVARLHDTRFAAQWLLSLNPDARSALLDAVVSVVAGRSARWIAYLVGHVRWPADRRVEGQSEVVLEKGFAPSDVLALERALAKGLAAELNANADSGSLLVAGDLLGEALGFDMVVFVKRAWRDA